jgi:hypothetical protein
MFKKAVQRGRLSARTQAGSERRGKAYSGHPLLFPWQRVHSVEPLSDAITRQTGTRLADFFNILLDQTTGIRDIARILFDDLTGFECLHDFLYMNTPSGLSFHFFASMVRESTIDRTSPNLSVIHPPPSVVHTSESDLGVVAWRRPQFGTWWV